MSNFLCSLTSNITSNSMRNLASHSLLRWKMIILQILITSPIHFSLGRLGECSFGTWEWKGSEQKRFLSLLLTLYPEKGSEALIPIQFLKSQVKSNENDMAINWKHTPCLKSSYELQNSVIQMHRYFYMQNLWCTPTQKTFIITIHY